MGQAEKDHVVSEDLERILPGLRDAGYEVTSQAQPDYNCVAWAAGDDVRWWEPDKPGFYYWPEDVPQEYTPEAYAEAFRRLGYEKCQDARPQKGWEKVAIFATEDGLPAHAARQLPDGRWASKLGKREDIVHSALEHVSGQFYGRPVIVLRRRRQKAGFGEETP